MPDDAENQKHAGSVAEDVLDSVKAALSQMRFGAIHLTIHDSRVVRLDVTERQRFPL